MPKKIKQDRSISFFSFWNIQIFPHLLQCHAIGINYLLIFYLSALRILNFLRQVKSVIRIIA